MSRNACCICAYSFAPFSRVRSFVPSPNRIAVRYPVAAADASIAHVPFILPLRSGWKKLLKARMCTRSTRRRGSVPRPSGPTHGFRTKLRWMNVVFTSVKLVSSSGGAGTVFVEFVEVPFSEPTNSSYGRGSTTTLAVAGSSVSGHGVARSHRRASSPRDSLRDAGAAAEAPVASLATASDSEPTCAVGSGAIPFAVTPTVPSAFSTSRAGIWEGSDICVVTGGAGAATAGTTAASASGNVTTRCDEYM
mmetsp:Transcript_50932/g.157169  ORF Transcript_50932/g.157169 Transcript_50932/m.157169 type:complete len:249 (+) Transcript_50932:834-1580(+)